MALILVALGSGGSYAAEDFLPPEQAFKVTARMADAGHAEIRWRIAPGYYLYREPFRFSAKDAVLGDAQIPVGKVKFDETFQKNVETYRDELKIILPISGVGAAARLLVVSQGCADAGLCYPPMTSELALNLPAMSSPEASTAALMGLTTPRADKTVGVLTNAGGAIRSVVSGDFNINQGKVITAQGGDILLFSTRGSIDAGRGAKTTLSTPPPLRRPILDAEGNQIGVQIIIPASATGSGIQSLTSDPDGLGPLAAPKAGDVYLFAPSGTIDAGEAGIRSSGNIVINAQTVLNGSNISVAGSSVGVPVATSGSLAATVASSGTATNTSRAGEDAATAASNAARAAAAADGLQKPTILTVEVLGFGDKNCKEQQKDCFAK